MLLCVSLATALAWRQGVELAWLQLALISAAALSAHIAVNIRNEVEDFASGLDKATTPTPFSGGSGFLPQHPQLADFAKKASRVALLVTALLGLACSYSQPLLVAIGALGIGLIYTYTTHLTRHPQLCALAPGIAFGPVVIAGTLLALGGQLGVMAVVISAVAALAVSALLIVNQLPDQQADRQFGRKTWVVCYGESSALLMASTLWGVISVLLLLTAWHYPSPAWGLPAPATVWIAVRLTMQAQSGQAAALALLVHHTAAVHLLLACCALLLLLG